MKRSSFYEFFEVLKVKPLTAREKAFNSSIFVSKATFEKFRAVTKDKKAPIIVEINDFVLNLELSVNQHLSNDCCELGKCQREYLNAANETEIKVTLYVNTKTLVNLTQIIFKVSKAEDNLKSISIQESTFNAALKKQFLYNYFRVHQQILFEFEEQVFRLDVIKSDGIDPSASSQNFIDNVCGLMVNDTEIELLPSDPRYLTIVSPIGSAEAFKKSFNLDNLLVGGLDQKLAEISRRVFSTRRFPPSYLRQFGINHVRGILLYGPPGTGKTLIAREISRAFRAKNMHIINGPELLDKMVGESEKKIRELFATAKNDQALYGEKSPLHVIILDEVDAICRKRGGASTDSVVTDNMVNQLLSMIDGVEALDNVLLIGMTNRKDLIDEALLRPGRLEVHIEISLPDDKGREQIFKIHTQNLVKHQRLSKDVDFKSLVSKTVNFTGAEISGVIRNACSYAFESVHDIHDFKNELNLSKDCKVNKDHFEKAIENTVPYFGQHNDTIQQKEFSLISSGNFVHFKNTLSDIILKSQNFPEPLFTILLYGPSGCGKTTWATWASTQRKFNFYKSVSEQEFIGADEGRKVQEIATVFNDACLGGNSCVIFDNLEEIIGYSKPSNYYSIAVAQTFSGLIEKIPKSKNQRVLVIATTSERELLKDLGILRKFKLAIKIPLLDCMDPIIQILHEIKLPSEQMKIAKKIQKRAERLTFKKVKTILELMDLHGPNPKVDSFKKYYKLMTD